MTRYKRGEMASIDGETLKQLRLRAGLSQADLAKSAGCSAQTIGKFERGEVGYTSVELGGKLAQALGLNITDIKREFVSRPLRGVTLLPFFGLAPEIPSEPGTGPYQDFHFIRTADVINQPIATLWADPLGSRISATVKADGRAFLLQIDFCHAESTWGCNLGIHPQNLTARRLDGTETYLCFEMRMAPSCRTKKPLVVSVRLNDASFRDWPFVRRDGTGRVMLRVNRNWQKFRLPLRPDAASHVCWSTSLSPNDQRTTRPNMEFICRITLDLGCEHPSAPSFGEGAIQLRPIIFE